jgi:hypothetical protein
MPQGAVRRGFDQQQQQRQQRRQPQPQQGGNAAAADAPLQVQDVWAEAVAVLRANGGDVKVRGWRCWRLHACCGLLMQHTHTHRHIDT